MDVAARCCICSTFFGRRQATDLPVCGHHACRERYRRIPEFRLCGTCRRPLAERDVGAGSCGTISCRVPANAAGVDRFDRQQAVSLALRAELASLQGRKDAAAHPVLRVPSLRKRTRALPKARRDRFRKHLESVVAAAFEAGTTPTVEPHSSVHSAESSAPPAARCVAVKACMLCKGDCCEPGGTRHAFIDGHTIARVRAAQPSLGPEAIVEAYLGRIGARTYDSSCVFHGSRGCTLPREMRADICNAYFCRPLDEYLRSADTTTRRAFVAYRETGGRVRGRFVEALDP